MAAVSFTNKTSGSSLLAGNVGFGTAFEHIQTITAGPLGLSYVTFSNIPQVYRSLHLRIMSRDTVVDTGVSNIEARFNGDSGNSYVRHTLQSYSGTSAQPTVSSSYFAAQSTLPIGSAVDSSESANNFCPTIVDFVDYADTTKYKTVRCVSGYDKGSSYSLVYLTSGVWMSNAAINSITLITNPSGNFSANSTFALYGTK